VIADLRNLSLCCSVNISDTYDPMLNQPETERSPSRSLERAGSADMKTQVNLNHLTSYLVLRDPAE
jgi:hypothetical protein